jgi:hypothetical protein
MSETNTQTNTAAPEAVATVAADASAPVGHPVGHEVKKVEPENTTGSSIFSVNPQTTKSNQFKMPTWGLLSTLIVAFFILKFFIYIKDDKRHGK